MNEVIVNRHHRMRHHNLFIQLIGTRWTWMHLRQVSGIMIMRLRISDPRRNRLSKADKKRQRRTHLLEVQVARLGHRGAAMKSEALQASVIADIVLLACVGLRIIFVHSGGSEINQWLGRLNIEPNFLNGLRVTDASTMEIVSMVLVGKVNKHLVALINKAGATAVGLSGIDGHLLIARPSPNSSQLGFVGDIASVDPTIIRPLIDNNHIPVIASVAADLNGQPYNINNADTAAGELAAALGAEKLILLTDVAGILENREDPRSLVKQIDIKGVKKMIEDGKVAGRMIPKVNCCIRSLAQGVRTTSIIDGRLKHSLLLEILTDEGAGTMITG
ncbi:hypothetical protein DH2020_046617 [Rehmannia glutinosa]|uniref:Aspartate/glutamate/uridylate kinase domain-containing protein n=1 Tax=Rehmannia glutinosa TaxID=99300 RepID=A0ABR0UBQ4_REHGL